MAGLLRMSEAATLALHALAYLARNTKRLNTSREMAGVLDLSEAHLAKVMQRLERFGLVRGRRGPAGGFALAEPADRLSLRRIYESIEGPLKSECCLLGRPLGRNQCPLGRLLKKTEAELADRLDKITLAEFSGRADLRGCSGVKAPKGESHAA